MTNILLVLSSPRGGSSHSTQIARSVVARLQAAHPGAGVTVRDLGHDPLPHIDEDFVAGLGTDVAQRTPAQAAAIARSDAVVREVLDADAIVVGSAMINFGLSSTLKAWFDHLLRAGSTFKYTAEGPLGLVPDRKVYLVEARGGVYSTGPARDTDFQEPYLKQLLAFIGITDVEVIAVEGVALGEDVAKRALGDAMARVRALAA